MATLHHERPPTPRIYTRRVGRSPRLFFAFVGRPLGLIVTVSRLFTIVPVVGAHGGPPWILPIAEGDCSLLVRRPERYDTVTVSSGVEVCVEFYFKRTLGWVRAALSYNLTGYPCVSRQALVRVISRTHYYLRLPVSTQPRTDIRRVDRGSCSNLRGFWGYRSLYKPCVLLGSGLATVPITYPA